MSEGLRGLGEHLGIPVDSPEFGAHTSIGQQLTGRLLAPVMPLEERRSLAAMLARVKTLPPIALDAELLNGPGEAPLLPRIRVPAQEGLVLSTRVHYFENGHEVGQSADYGGLGGELAGLPQMGPALWRLVVRRTGVGPTGYVRLEKSFRTRATAPYVPPPPPPREPPPVPPQISAVKQQTDQGVMVRVTGSGFLPNQPANEMGIAIKLVDAVRVQDFRRFVTGSDAAGGVDALVGPVLTDNLQRNAAGQAQVSVSATDSRTDPGSVPGGAPLWSNTVTLSF